MSKATLNKLERAWWSAAGRDSKPLHPTMYDITDDARRYVSQYDVDRFERQASEGQLRSILMRRLLNLDLDQLQRLRKLYDENFTGPPKPGS